MRKEAAEKERDEAREAAARWEANFDARCSAATRDLDRLERAQEELEYLDRVRRVSERDQRPVPHWVIVEVCGALRALSDDSAGHPTDDAETTIARVRADALEEAAKLAETSKGYPTNVSEAIRALSNDPAGCATITEGTGETNG